MPADLDQFGRENSHGAVIGWKGLVELGHMSTNARSFLNQIHLKTSAGKIKRGLNTADPSPNNQYVSKITVPKTSGYLLHDFSWQYFVFHFIAPRQVRRVTSWMISVISLISKMSS